MLQFIFISILTLSLNSFAVSALDKNPTSSQHQLNHEKQHLLESEKNSIDVFKKSAPLVVSVDSTQIATDFFSTNYHEVPAGSGTGFIWDNQGHIITNFHVIQNASRNSKISVTTKNGKRYKAKVIGVEPKKDIAVLKVNELKKSHKGFSELISDSNQLVVGQKVLAIGNPFGFDLTLTQGIISALNRSMPSVQRQYTIRGMIQTDASINPGNSGGPLISSRGTLVGMNTSIISGSGTSAGIGFAVPANTIKRVAQQIIDFGEVIQPGLGITIIDGYQKHLLKRYYGYNINGIVIEDVFGKNAKNAGLQGLKKDYRGRVIIGDVITKVDDKKVEDVDDLYNLLSEKKVGEKVNVSFNRKGKEMKRVIALQKLPSNYKQIP